MLVIIQANSDSVIVIVQEDNNVNLHLNGTTNTGHHYLTSSSVRPLLTNKQFRYEEKKRIVPRTTKRSLFIFHLPSACTGRVYNISVNFLLNSCRRGPWHGCQTLRHRVCLSPLFRTLESLSHVIGTWLAHLCFCSPARQSGGQDCRAVAAKRLFILIL